MCKQIFWKKNIEKIRLTLFKNFNIFLRYRSKLSTLNFNVLIKSFYKIYIYLNYLFYNNYDIFKTITFYDIKFFFNFEE